VTITGRADISLFLSAIWREDFFVVGKNNGRHGEKGIRRFSIVTKKAPVFETDARINDFKIPRWGGREIAPSRCGSAAALILIRH
jgi:hypothetical protein